MAAMIFSALFGLAVAAASVQVAALWRDSFSWRAVAASAVGALVFIVAVAAAVGYFLARVRIGDHYEANSTLIGVFVVGPAAAGAVVGAVVGALAARYMSGASASRNRRTA
jgi:uncharacterized membrane protein YcjF (UPF0283 family)